MNARDQKHLKSTFLDNRHFQNSKIKMKKKKEQNLKKKRKKPHRTEYLRAMGSLQKV
jgi:hypothetical protein